MQVKTLIEKLSELPQEWEVSIYVSDDLAGTGECLPIENLFVNEKERYIQCH